MPTLAGLRRRGYTPEAIRAFCERIGVAKTDSIVDVGLLEHGLREDLNRRSPARDGGAAAAQARHRQLPGGRGARAGRAAAPGGSGAGDAQGAVLARASTSIATTSARTRPRTGSGWRRGARCACATPAWSRCTRVVKDASGEVTELHATWDPASWGGSAPDGRTVRGTLHWVSAAHAVPAEVRLYDRLFSVENPGTDESKSFLDEMNPDSVVRVAGAVTEPYVGDAGEARHARPVRARRLLLPRPGQHAGQADLEPHRRPQGQLGEDREQGARQGEAATRGQAPPRKPRLKAEPAPPPAEIAIDDLDKVDLRVGLVQVGRAGRRAPTSCSS